MDNTDESGIVEIEGNDGARHSSYFLAIVAILGRAQFEKSNKRKERLIDDR